MSIAAPPSTTAAARAGAAKASRVGQLIDQRIDEACNALWWAELTRTMLRLVIVSIGILLAWLVIDQWVIAPGPLVRWALLATLVTGLGWYLYQNAVPLFRSSIRPEYAAWSLERDVPDLRQTLTSYVTLRDQRDGTALRNRVIRSIGTDAAGHLQAHDQLPAEATGTLRWWVAAIGCLAVLAAYSILSPKNSLKSVARLAAPFASIDPVRRVSIDDVQPGDSEANAGRSIEVSATINGLRSGEEAVCVLYLSAAKQETVMASGDDARRYVADLKLPFSVSGLVDYTIEAGDAVAGPYQLRVKDVPAVALQSVHYQPPAYTGKPPRTTSVGAIAAIDGTQVTIRATTNRPIARAKIEFNPKPLGSGSLDDPPSRADLVRATAGATEMQIDPDGTELSTSFPLRSARGRAAAVELDSYRISVWDSNDQRNPSPIVYPIQVITDLPPEVSITLPVRTPKDLPITLQQAIEVHASDPDFGLKQITLQIRSGIDLIAEPVLWKDAEGSKGNRVAEYGLRPLELGLRIGDTVEVVAVATDNRVISNDRSAEPNTAKTDPIELRIVADGDVPREGDPDADGVAPPADQSATEPQSQQSGDGAQSGGSGQQQGGGSEGEGQQGGEGGSAQQNQGQQNQSSEGAGSGASQGNQPGESDSRDSGDQSSGDQSSAGQNNGSNQQPSDGSPAGSGDSPSGDSPEGDSAQGDSSSEPGMQNGEAASPQDGTQNSDAGNSDAGNSDASSAANPGEFGEETGNARSDGSDGAPTGNAGSQGNAGQQGDSSDGSAPQHDGEAFERIKEYLEQQRKEQEREEQERQQQAPGNESPQPTAQQQNTGDGSQGDQAAKRQQGAPNDQGNQGSPDSGDGGNQNRQGSDRHASGSEDASDPAGEKNSGGEQEVGQDADGQPQGDQPREGQATGDSQRPDGSQGAESSQASDAGEPGDRSDRPGQQNSQQNNGQNQSGDQSAGSESDPQGGEQGSDQTDGPQQGGSKGDDNASSGQQGSSESAGQSGDSQASGNESGSDSSSSRPDSGSESNPNQNAGGQSPGSARSGNQNPGNSAARDGAPQGTPGDGASGDAGAGDGAEPPQPPNADYAKKATDLVLDYLKETRDQPNRELLDKLNWSEQDLKRFADRWEKVREMSPPNSPDPLQNQNLREALESLGMRPGTGPSAGATRETADTLRSIRDAGNRIPPPAAYRDAFDATRRAVGQ